MLKPTALLLALATTSALADRCETVRSEIEDKIRAAGVKEFSVVVVEPSASAPGKVVGNCDQGTRKIVYSRKESSPAQSTSAAKAAPRSSAEPAPIITECKDGSTAVGGQCKK